MNMLETGRKSRYDKPLESALSRIENLLGGDYGISGRAVGLLLLQGDPQMERRVEKLDASGYALIRKIVAETGAGYGQPLSYVLALRRQQEARRVLAAAVTVKEKTGGGFAERLSRAMMRSPFSL